MPQPKLLDRIEAKLDELRPSEQLVARYVLRHPNMVINLAQPELARRAKVSQPTVARFCAALDFAGFKDFKLRLAQSLAQGVPFVHRDVRVNDSAADVGAKVFDRAISSLVSARNHLDAAKVEHAITLLTMARRIECYGAGNSGIVAMDAQHKFFRLGVPVVAYADAHVHAMAASLLGKGDVVLAISGTGNSTDLNRSVEIAREAGAAVIAVTASDSALCALANVSLIADVPEDVDAYAPMTSRLVHLTIIDVLAVGVALARGEPLLAKLARAKEVLAEKRSAAG